MSYSVRQSGKKRHVLRREMRAEPGSVLLHQEGGHWAQGDHHRTTDFNRNCWSLSFVKMSDEKQEMIPDGNDGKGDMNTATDEKDVDGSELDSSKVKFINANGGADAPDAHVTIADDPSDNAFCGLTKEELMKYADDPYWVRVRWILMILFWVAWFGMLAAAIVIIILAPKCPPRPKLEWWQKSSMCQVVPASYQDTDGDGMGDLKGEYLKKQKKKRSMCTLRYKKKRVGVVMVVESFADATPLFCRFSCSSKSCVVHGWLKGRKKM